MILRPMSQAGRAPFRRVACKFFVEHFIPTKPVDHQRFAKHQPIAAPGGGTAMARRPPGFNPRGFKKLMPNFTQSIFGVLNNYRIDQSIAEDIQFQWQARIPNHHLRTQGSTIPNDLRQWSGQFLNSTMPMPLQLFLDPDLLMTHSQKTGWQILTQRILQFVS